MIKVLATVGAGKFFETEYEVPEMLPTDIRVRSVMTGVCRSDIDMMQGNFGPLPLNMQGHEGLGQVIDVGLDVRDVKIGDYVATRGEPAYADIYNVRDKEYVVVPEAHPRYILEPVACGLNCIVKDFFDRGTSKTIILGSGFLAWVVYNGLTKRFPNMSVDVLGASNTELWKDKLLVATAESYDNVIDLSGKYGIGTDINLNNNALIVDAVGKAVSKEEAQSQLWKACTTVKPSPRTPAFIESMREAKYMIKNGELEVDSFWTKCYNRNTEWQQAFADGVDRPSGYSRGYIKWD